MFNHYFCRYGRFYYTKIVVSFNIYMGGPPPDVRNAKIYQNPDLWDHNLAGDIGYTNQRFKQEFCIACRFDHTVWPSGLNTLLCVWAAFSSTYWVNSMYLMQGEKQGVLPWELGLQGACGMFWDVKKRQNLCANTGQKE